MLRESGLFDRLEEMGIQDGDTVSLYNLEFEYQNKPKRRPEAASLLSFTWTSAAQSRREKSAAS